MDNQYKNRDNYIDKEDDEIIDQNINNREENEEKFDLSNLLKFLTTNKFKCKHLFVDDSRVVFILIETIYNYLLIYIPSKFSIIINNKTLNQYIPITNIKVENEDEEIKLNKKSNIMKENLKNSMKMFMSNPVKMSYINKDNIVYINRHNEIEYYTLETYTPYDNMYWIIDLENFYTKFSNIDLELKNINNNILLSLYSNFDSNKKDAINILNKQIKELNEIDKKLVCYSELEKRMNNITNKINREKNISKREEQINIYKPNMNNIYNNYMLELMKWNNYFSLLFKQCENSDE
jgi:hypothetical protein